MSQQPFKPNVDALVAALGKRPPFCTGVTPLDNHGVLFYRKGEEGDAGYLDFASATEDRLKDLTMACSPASFGHGKETVYDETYRKARKLDTNRFSSLIDIYSSGIAQHVTNELLEGENSKRELRFELYKLNVYEMGSFFKAHKDTPRAENMFGSLVITFPTAHVGGSLALRHEGEEWTVDSSSIFAEQSQPSMCFVAFYSDVEHEVFQLQSGYRVTLTYNLYVEEKKRESHKLSDLPTIPIHRSVPDQHAFKTALTSFIQDSRLFPNGGVLAFGLRFKYPVIPSETNLERIVHVLKGSDATIKDVALSLGLEVVPELILRDTREGVDIMYSGCRSFVYQRVSSWPDHLASRYARDPGFVVHELGKPEPQMEEVEEQIFIKEVIWATPRTDFTKFESTYVSYKEGEYFGNEAGVECIYGDLVLAVMIGPPGHRETLTEVPKKDGFRSPESQSEEDEGEEDDDEEEEEEDVEEEGMEEDSD